MKKKKKSRKEITNAKRAARAFMALRAWIEASQEPADEYAFRDLLADLMHLADVYGYDFAAEIDQAADNYQAEK